MTDLVERYIHQVGYYLPQKERADIEAELRSQIQDQLDDRYGESPLDEEIVSVLTELGHPYKMALVYSSDKYLIGPDLYPFMMVVLRYGWLIIPAIVLFLSIFDVLTSSADTTFIGLIIEPIFATIQVTFVFSALVVLFFAILERSNLEFDEETNVFKPLELPQVDDPTTVDRFESAFGMAFGMIVVLLLVYFLRVGGLTFTFNLSNPGEIIPVPLHWMAILIVAAVTMLIMNLFILRKNRWTVRFWITQTVLELIGIVCLYYVAYTPFFEHVVMSIPVLANLPLIDRGAEIVAIVTAISTLTSRWGKTATLWNYKDSKMLPYTAQLKE